MLSTLSTLHQNLNAIVLRHRNMIFETNFLKFLTANFSFESNSYNSWLCPKKHFICNHGCASSEHGRIAAYVCNGENNCINGRDENFCDQNVSKKNNYLTRLLTYLFISIQSYLLHPRFVRMDLNVGGSVYQKN